MDWHRRDAEDVIRGLGSSLSGLNSGEAASRLLEHGPNSLIEKPGKSPVLMFLDQFRDFMIVVLIAAAAVSGLIGDISDTIAIMVIVTLNAIIGFVQEYRAEQAMAALKRMAAPSATAIRDGRAMSVPASSLVPGDMVSLEAGQIVPADLRLVEAASLKMEEAALTGECIAVEKQTGLLAEKALPIGDRSNMAYKGTIVSYGRGNGVVIATGMGTELGRIATMLQEEEEVKTPLQKRLAAFGKRLALAILCICAVVFILGLFRGEAPDRHIPCSGGHTRGPPRGHNHLAGTGRQEAAQEEGPYQEAPGGGDTGLGNLYMLGQDRHAYPEQDDRRYGIHWQPHGTGR
jgi:Ca2+-transporting ATPase